MLRAIIIDDEVNGIKTLRLLIEKYCKDVKVVASSSQPIDGIILIEDYKPDLVFLDITMPKMNGFELLEKLSYRSFKLIFTTAHEQYALKAIKSGAVDYLLKPIDVEELQKCVKNLMDGGENTNYEKVEDDPKNIIVSVRDGIIFLKPNEVVRLEAAGSYTNIYLTNSTMHLASKSLKDYESILDKRIFYRCHNSHIVNLTKINKLINTDGLFVQMSDNSITEVARKNREQLLERLKNI